MQTERTVSVKKQYMTMGEITDEEEYDSDRIEIELPPEGTPMAEVAFGKSYTRNLGDYNSKKVEVKVNLPCIVPELEAAMHRAIRLVDEIQNNEDMQ